MPVFGVWPSKASPSVLPTELQDEMEILSKLKGKEDVLRATYDFLSLRYRGRRLKTVTRIWELYSKDLGSLWRRKGFLHCTNLNYLLYVLLVGSGKFGPSDIRYRWTVYLWSTAHQYLQVNTGEGWVDVDVWAGAYGVSLGKHAGV
jgi:hypothetical protein